MTQNESYPAMVVRLQKPMGEFRYELKHLMAFVAIAGLIADLADQLDLVKKASLYEDPNRLQGLSKDGVALFEHATLEAQAMEQEGVNPTLAAALEREEIRHLIHHMVGFVGEAGEIATVLYRLLTTGEFDRTNLIEELGDGGFYATGIMEALGVTREHVEQVNQAKLSTGKNARYKDGFSNEAALNRNLEGERANLEASTAEAAYSGDPRQLPPLKNLSQADEEALRLDSATASFITAELRKLPLGKSLVLTPMGDELTLRVIDTSAW